MFPAPTDRVSRILAVSVTGIGNTILFTPVLVNLRQIYPGASIDFVGTSSTVEVVRGSSFVDKVHVYSRNKRWRLIPRLRNRRYDVSVCACVDRGAFLPLMMRLSGVRDRIGFGGGRLSFLYSVPLSASFEKHETEHNLDIIRAMGREPRPASVFFHVGTPEERRVDAWLEDRGISPDRAVVGFHPGSTAETRYKRWPLEYWQDLGRRLRRRGFAVAVLGGAEETHLCREVAAVLGDDSANAAGHFGIKETAALIRRCRVFVAGDTGLGHVASAVETPLASIFGPTSVVKSSPLGQSVRILKADFPCQPCYLSSGPSCADFDCMRAVTPDRVERAVEELHREANPGMEPQSSPAS